MSDVDAIRWMASERDLEFVDLDTYGVDPAAGEILPVALSRQYHVVAIKRKFGTPVVATADPDDLAAQDTVRESIGRDFISVVAAPDQISAYLDQLFGAEGQFENQAVLEGDTTPPEITEEKGFGGFSSLDEATPGLDEANPGLDEAIPGLDEATPGLDEAISGLDAAISGLDEAIPSESLAGPVAEDAVPTEEGAVPTEEEQAVPTEEAVDSTGHPILVALEGEGVTLELSSDLPVVSDDSASQVDRAAEEEALAAQEEAPAAVEQVPVTGGKRRRRREESKRAKAKSAEKSDSLATADVVESSRELDDSPSIEPLWESPSEAPEAVTPVGDEDSPAFDSFPSKDPLESALAATPEEATQEDAGWISSDTNLEPATSLLPGFGTETGESDWPPMAEGPVQWPQEAPAPAIDDPLAELARSLQGDQQLAEADATTSTADLVAEAFATYQEQHAVGEDFGEASLEAPTETSLFPPLAKALVDGGRVSLEDIEPVLEEHYRTGQTIARILMGRGLVSEADLMWGMAEEMGLDFVDLDVVGVDLAEAGTIPEATSRHHNVLVIANDDGTPVVAASNPTDVFAMDDLRTIMGRNFIVVVATRSQISSYIGRAFHSAGDAADMAMEASLGFDGEEGEAGVDDIQAVTEEAPIVRYVNLLILQALNERASDIHVEPTATDLRIRYRIDGVLHDVSTAPRSISAAVITRLKVMADMNVAEHRIPQDGRISLNVGSKGIDLRIATLPTIHGEKVVMRVLDKSSVVLGFPDLGFDDDLLTTYEGLYTKPYGTILVTGPTGSGKSTTLYTTLTALNSPEKNIITVEDPVELQLKGVNQVQLNVKAGLTFASALKSILRSDPDIVLVGEIRDKETALIAIEAALTGHMVLATLHTNSAAATPMRLVEMGIEPFLVTSSLSGVLAQRLARRLCPHCKEAYEPTEAEILSAGWSREEAEQAGGISKVYRAVGCSACANTGYRGRKALAELLPMTEEIEKSIIEGGSVEDIHRIAVAQGMLTLRQSGLRKAIEGETTLEEVLRVVA